MELSNLQPAAGSVPVSYTHLENNNGKITEKRTVR